MIFSLVWSHVQCRVASFHGRRVVGNKLSVNTVSTWRDVITMIFHSQTHDTLSRLNEIRDDGRHYK